MQTKLQPSKTSGLEPTFPSSDVPKAPDYEHDAAVFLESINQPFARAEYVSLSPGLQNLNATAYKGPALVISGEYDFSLCGGHCPKELEPAFAPLFSGARDFETCVQSLAGHAVNSAINATGFHGVIFEYLARKGICGAYVAV